MRKVSTLAATALCNGRTFSKLNNTRVNYDNGANALVMRLHDNPIAAWQYDDETLSVSLAGYNTVTTRERVNAVLEVAGSPYRFKQKNHEAIVINTLTGWSTEVFPLHWYSLSHLAKLEAA